MPKKSKNNLTEQQKPVKKTGNAEHFFRSNKNIALLLIVVAILSASAAIITGLFIKITYSPEKKPVSDNSEKKIQIINKDIPASIPVLMYHYVEQVKDPKDTIRISLNTNPVIFKAQMQTLKNEGYTFLKTGQLGQILDGSLSAPEKPIAVTFDDGYKDFYTDVYPVLKEMKIPVTVFIISDSINKKNFMSEYDLKEIQTSGLVEFGSHTATHKNLSQLSMEQKIQEITLGKMQIEKLTETKAESFAYPYGSFNKESIEAVMNAGFTVAFSTVEGTTFNQSVRFTLPRLRPGIFTGSSLVQFLEKSDQISYKALVN